VIPEVASFAFQHLDPCRSPSLANSVSVEPSGKRYPTRHPLSFSRSRKCHCGRDHSSGAEKATVRLPKSLDYCAPDPANAPIAALNGTCAVLLCQPLHHSPLLPTKARRIDHRMVQAPQLVDHAAQAVGSLWAGATDDELYRFWGPRDWLADQARSWAMPICVPACDLIFLDEDLGRQVARQRGFFDYDEGQASGLLEGHARQVPASRRTARPARCARTV